MRTNPPPPVFLALAAATVAVSLAAILIRLAGTPPLVTAAARMGLSALIVAPLGLWRGRAALRGLTARDLGLMALSGLFLALHFASWISSLSLTSVASSVVLVTTSPLWVALLSPLVGGDRLTRLMLLGIVIATVGGVIVGVGDTLREGGALLGSGNQALLGDGLALIGALTAALYLLAGRSVRQKLAVWPYISVVYSVAAVLLIGLALATGQNFRGTILADGTLRPYSGQTYLMLFLVAAVPQLIGHTGYNYALGWFSASFIAVALLAEPIGATILAYLLLGEPLTAAKVGGGALILLGIYLATRGERPQPAPAPIDPPLIPAEESP